MRFSIIIPVYNVENYLRCCLDSVLNQTYSDYEIICINDASKDSSYEILRQYEKKTDKLRIINNMENCKQSICRNIGLEMAKGEYIWFIDADDFIVPNALQILDSYLQESRVDVLGFDFDIIYDGITEQNLYKGRKIYQTDIMSGTQLFVQYAYNNEWIRVPWKAILRRDFLQRNTLTFYPEIFYEDILFFIQVHLKAQTVRVVKDVLYTYRKRPMATTTFITVRNRDSLVVVLGELFSLWKRGYWETELDNAIYKYILNVKEMYDDQVIQLGEKGKLCVGTAADEFFHTILRHYTTSDLLPMNLIEKLKREDNVIIYGAGVFAKNVIDFLDTFHIGIKKIAVSDKKGNLSQFMNLTVYSITELVEEKDEACIVVCVRQAKPVLEYLKQLEFKKVLCIHEKEDKI